MQVNPISRSDKAVDAQGRPTEKFNLFTEAVSQLVVSVGTGSPNGVLSAFQGKLYIDLSGGSGSVLYVKQVDSVGSDRTLGWVLV